MQQSVSASSQGIDMYHYQRCGIFSITNGVVLLEVSTWAGINCITKYGSALTILGDSKRLGRRQADTGGPK